MINVTTKGEKKSLTQEMSPSCQIDVSYEDFVEALQNLRTNESSLIDQKEQLTNMLNQLENKAKDEVKKRKSKVGRLISEVEDLKKKCEKYANLINSEPDLE
jgi:DNA repair ATPase RecN